MTKIVLTKYTMYEYAFAPEVIIVKSSRLKKLVSQCKVWEAIK